METSSGPASGFQASKQITADGLYTPIREWQTRVLKLHPGTDEQPLVVDLLVGILVHNHSGLATSIDGDLIEYEAISYTWGELVLNRAMLVNGITSMITENLEKALKRFRYESKYRHLWADQLCINQADNDEKSQQVMNMFNIFRNAEGVLVWLGEAREYTANAVQFCRGEIPGTYTDVDDDGDGDPNLSDSKQNSDLYSGLIDLCCRPWNRRAWIQQEIFAARKVQIHCGGFQISLAQYQRAATRLNQITRVGEHEAHCEAIERLALASDNEFVRLESQRRSETEWTCVRSGGEECTRIECVLGVYRGLEATDPRDRVYSLLNMTNCRTWREERGLERKSLAFLRVDYNRTVSEVFQDVTKYIINREGTINRLFDSDGFLFGSRTTEDSHEGVMSPVSDVKELRLRYQRTKNLPSWTIDWALFDKHTQQTRRYGLLEELKPLSQWVDTSEPYPDFDLARDEFPSQRLEDEGFIRIIGMAIGLFGTKPQSSGELEMYVPRDLGQLSERGGASLLESMLSPQNPMVGGSYEPVGTAVFKISDPVMIRAGDFVVAVKLTRDLVVLREREGGGWTLVRSLRWGVMKDMEPYIGLDDSLYRAIKRRCGASRSGVDRFLREFLIY